MNNKLICPFCGKDLERYWYEDFECWYCNNMCCKGFSMTATDDMWQELIRTRKALDVALDWLGQVTTPAKCDDELCREFTKRKLAEIKTAIEQKG